MRAAPDPAPAEQDVDPEPTAHRTSRWFRIVWLAARWVPNRYGSRPRVWLLRREGASVGERVTIGPRVKVLGVKGLVLENGAGVARDALIDARAGLVVGRQAMVGFESLILSWTHRFDNPEVAIRVQGSYGRPVRIGNGAWIGARVIVLPGIDVGDDAIVGAASVVTRSVAAGAIVAGNPARDIGRRDPAGA